MISPKEIKFKAEKWWNDGSFLMAFLNNQEFFEKEISKIGLVDVSKVHENYKTIIAEQDLLKANSKEAKGYGYVLEWEGKNFQKIGNNQFIRKVVFKTQDDFLKFIGKEKVFHKFKENVVLLEEALPQLKEWIKTNPLKVVDYENEWVDLLKVCKYFIEDHIPGKYYIRELPINIHTKFIEGHKQILFSLLDFCIPEKSNVNAKNDFCLRYNLKDKENLVRIRILGDDLKPIFAFSDFSIPLSELRNATINASTVFITENLMNFLTLPKRNNSIALWSGGGFNVSYLANINWLKEKQIIYWGDIDAAGLQILSQIRTYYDHVQSLMMDRDTFVKFYEAGKGKPTSAVELKGLNTEEKEFFMHLKENDFRLEQEKIPQEYVIQQINLIKSIKTELDPSNGAPTQINIMERPPTVLITDLKIEPGQCLLNSYKVAKKYPEVEIIEGVIIYIDKNNDWKPMAHAWNRLGTVNFDVTNEKIWVGSDEEKKMKEVRYGCVRSFYASVLNNVNRIKFSSETDAVINKISETVELKDGNQSN